MLKTIELSVNYGTRRVLNGVTLEINACNVLGLIGPNGAGKTTLIRALSGVIPAASGQVWVNGQPLAALSPAQRARWVAVVPQARNLPAAFTAYETVALGRTPHVNWLGALTGKDSAAVETAMRRTGTLELADRAVGELSGGEQQRLLIARALAQAAPILLLDEPTTSLDLRYQMELLELVRSLAHEDHLAVLMAMHDLNLAARFTDRVALMVEGSIRALGPISEVLTEENLSRAFRMPIKVLPENDSHPMMVLPFAE